MVLRIAPTSTTPTLLNLMGLDDKRLEYLQGGRLRKLTDIGGNVLKEIIA